MDRDLTQIDFYKLLYLADSLGYEIAFSHTYEDLDLATASADQMDTYSAIDDAMCQGKLFELIGLLLLKCVEITMLRIAKEDSAISIMHNALLFETTGTKVQDTETEEKDPFEALRRLGLNPENWRHAGEIPAGKM